MKVGVIVPRVEIRGGVERALRAIVTYLLLGSKQHMVPCQVVVGLNGKDAHLEGALRDLRLSGLSLRQVRLDGISHEEAVELTALSGVLLRNDIPPGPWCVVRDEVCDFLDADVWIQVTTRTRVDNHIVPLVPLRPVMVFPFDLLEVRGSAGLDDTEVMQSLRVTRAADSVAVSTEATLVDLVAFAGISRDRIKQLPIEYHDDSSGQRAHVHHHEAAWGPYALWVTNSAPHKNHVTTLSALRLAKDECPDLRCIVVGWGSEHIIADLDESFLPWVSALGYVTDQELEALLASARFLIHSAIGDNGSFTPFQAASAGTLTVCADYPAMRDVASQRGLGCLWFDPYDESDLAAKVVSLWSEEDGYHDLLSEYRRLDTHQAASEWFQRWWGNGMIRHRV